MINTKDNHNKFWSITKATRGLSVIVRWGRIGTNGQSQVKEFITVTGANAFYAKKVAEKYEHGYVCVSESN
jgi:predicted DNA-binding WGR domain protein